MRFVARIWEMLSLEQVSLILTCLVPLAVLEKFEVGSDKASFKCWLP